MKHTRQEQKTQQSHYGERAKTAREYQRAYCVGVLPPGEDLTELKELLATAGVDVVGELIQRRQQIDPATYVGQGKLAELAEQIKLTDANLVVCDDELTPRQERAIESALEVAVIDRTATILDIFADHAHSAEGKLQIELAQLEYNLARMKGLWTHLERLGGGIGTRGPGESQIETDRRLARDRIVRLRRRLQTVRANRDVMRQERERAQLPNIALVGYTNAGKSTLLGALTHAEVSVGDRLFHTLDPLTRTTTFDGRTYLLTDTVGFIRKLPHKLVEAFGATLEETRRADLIVHVIDGSAAYEELQKMFAAVEAVLEEIEADGVDRLTVLNKVDRLSAAERQNRQVDYPDAILISARTGDGLDQLQQAIQARILAALEPVELLIPYNAGGWLAELHKVAGDLERKDTPTGVRITTKLAPGIAKRFERFTVKEN